ncbi:hypothetical protein PAPYR_13383 [Paratrimastix pyriformis]|uniref:Uncharacterized protein n=1 Tax=Paratrimastix pyriformis TaxID=342808 RepID=A0ABQ8U0E6_9EUKA|nr:hypothetical protein PAPYR_13383 [Paratrimastix pyriformis]
MNKPRARSILDSSEPETQATPDSPLRAGHQIHQRFILGLFPMVSLRHRLRMPRALRFPHHISTGDFFRTLMMHHC